ncbi:3-hydroxyacyl-CoA dehydrogenase [Paracoccus zhejiangensis]|uniref:3-hydroxyacyl-CoA dehydrogenase n=2 Tax=Paracoccus zhejiangensis TaxID=1077935 RepID=A0A2H5EVZ0_9RHOB|nr:3-hydroxyacyl-CoA dehydrogenase [Paracoccus zhejiangensis]
MEAMSAAVTLEREGEVALIRIDNPPVNAAGQPVREGLVKAVAALDADPGIRAAALYCAGRTFVAGADIREFGKPFVPPSLPETCDALAESRVPIVAVIQGTALGGGCEIAMACQARIGLPGAKLGLPEVNLGLLPGAGGTQRAPRLMGMAAALHLALSGKPIPAEKALSLGLLDEITDQTDPRMVALHAARRIASGKLATRRTDALTVTPLPAVLQAARETVAKSSPQLHAPGRIIEAIAASTRPIAEGQKEERRLFLESLEDPQRAALVHAFFAERAVAKFPEQDAKPRPIERIGVIGGGTMGSGIATACLLAGLQVVLSEQTEDALERGLATIGRNLDGAVKRGKLTADRVRATRAALTGASDLNALAGADLIIEAVFEKMEVKTAIFARLDGIAKPGAVLATNTSYLDLNQIAAATSRPQDVIGLHFFSPAHVMRLLEIVVADKTAPDVVATGFALAKRLGKIGVRAGVCDGFIGNRILSAYRRAAENLVLDGATPEQVDRAIRAFGMAMGPFEMGDLAGLDIAWASRRRHDATRPADERYSTLADKLYDKGWLGRKTGRGYYDHAGETPVPNPELPALIDAARAEAKATPRALTDQEVRDRYLTAMIAEGARVLEEGIARRPVDIDAVFLFGYGFPRHLGGPMFHADTIGAAELVRRIEEYAKVDPQFWTVPPLLARMAKDGTSFAALNEAG